MKIWLLIAISILLIMTSCSPNIGPITEAGAVVIPMGSRFTIELPSNITTGYSWEFKIPIDSNYLKLEKTYYLEPESGLVGSSGTQGWIFKTLQTGSTTISLVYLQPWEKSITSNQTAIFEINIQ